MAGESLTEEKKFDVLGLGAVAVDDIVYVDSYPPPDVKIRVRRSERQCGGLTATALVAAARSGAKCAYAGILGTESISEFAVHTLKSEGIDFSFGRRQDSARTIHSFIVVDTTNKTRNIFADSLGFIGPDLDWPSEEVIRSSRVLLVDHINPTAMARAARVARSSAIPVVGDLERDSGPGFSELFALIDHLIISDGFAQKLTGETSTIAALRNLWSDHREVVVVTCGEEGCWYLDLNCKGNPQHIPAFRVEALDTTGCGDVFHGAYAAVLAQGMAAEERLRFASAVAGLKAKQTGGQSGIPFRHVAEQFLKEQAAL